MSRWISPTNVDTASRLIEEKKFRVLAQPSCQKDLLLIAAEFVDLLLGAGCLDAKTLHETVDELALSFLEMPHCVRAGSAASVRFCTESSGMMSALRSSERKAIRVDGVMGTTQERRLPSYHRSGSAQTARCFDQNRANPPARRFRHAALQDAVEPVLIFETFRLQQHWPTCRVCSRPANAVTLAHLIGLAAQHMTDEIQSIERASDCVTMLRPSRRTVTRSHTA